MSSPQFTLYIHAGPGPNPTKVAFLLEALSLSYDVKPLEFGTGPGTVKSDEYVKLCPNGRVPALIDHSNGDFVSWESGAILFYLVDKYDKDGKYFGKTVEERTETMIWLTHQLSGLGPVQGNVNWFLHYHDWKGEQGAGTDSVKERYISELHRLHGVLEAQLARQEEKGSQFLVLDRPTIADYAFHAWLRIVSFAKQSHDDFPKLKAYAARMEELPEVKAGSGKVQKVIDDFNAAKKK